jgi:hypothetical protein
MQTGQWTWIQELHHATPHDTTEVVEHVLQQERGPLVRREALQHQQELQPSAQEAENGVSQR